MVLIGLLAPVAVSAADNSLSGPTQPGTITVSPAIKELTFGPGILNSTVDVVVTNSTSHPFSGTLRLVDFKALDQYGGITLGQAGVPLDQYGLANWMTVPGGPNVNLAAGQSIHLPVLVQNRDDLTPGGHYGAVVLSAGSGTTNNNISFNQQLTALIFLKKLGGDRSGLELESITPKESDVPSSVALRFKSTGNVFVLPRGYVTVTDPAGKLVAKGIINPDSAFVLQGTSRVLITIMQPVADAKLVGTYKITAYYRYVGQNNFSQKSIYFQHGALPKFVIYIVVLTVVILLISLYLIHQKAIRNHRRMF